MSLFAYFMIYVSADIAIHCSVDPDWLVTEKCFNFLPASGDFLRLLIFFPVWTQIRPEKMSGLIWI